MLGNPILVKICIKKALGRLKEREAQVLTLYFGLDGQPGMKLREIAVEMGLSKGRIWQIKRDGMGKLRKILHIPEDKQFV